MEPGLVNGHSHYTSMFDDGEMIQTYTFFGRGKIKGGQISLGKVI